MRILTRLRHAFGGGISLALALPEDFAWEGRTIPLTVQLTSRRTQSDTTGELRFHFYDEDRGTRSTGGTENGVDYRWIIPAPIELAAGDTLTRRVDMPLKLEGVLFGPRASGKIRCRNARRQVSMGPLRL